MQNQFEQELLLSQLEAQEHSLKHVNNELQDNIGQMLSTTKLLLGMALMQLETIPDALKTAEKSLSKAIQDIRLLSKVLNKEWLHEFDLIEKIKTETDHINVSKIIEAELSSQYEKLPIEPEAQVILYRIMHEILHNSIKNNSPEHIKINITKANRDLILSIEDDGMHLENATENFDLENMMKRIALLNGTMQCKSKKEKGTLITIKIPVNG